MLYRAFFLALWGLLLAPLALFFAWLIVEVMT